MDIKILCNSCVFDKVQVIIDEIKLSGYVVIIIKLLLSCYYCCSYLSSIVF